MFNKRRALMFCYYIFRFEKVCAGKLTFYTIFHDIIFENINPFCTSLNNVNGIPM